MKHKSGACLFAAAATLGLATASNAQEYAIDTTKLSAAVIAETNAYRQSKALPTVRANAALHKAAMGYAKFLAEKEAAGHTADGKSPAERVTAQGYNYCFVAENMWGGWQRPTPMTVSQAARKAMDGWKKSPGHNANMLDKRGHSIGVGAAAWTQGDKVVFRIVQVFGDECHSKPIVARAANKKGEASKKPAG